MLLVIKSIVHALRRRPGLTLFFLFYITGSSSADTVLLRNGEREKGLILEELKDRVIISTVDGEKEIMKSDIKAALYDSESKSLLRKGKNLMAKGKLVEAYYVFKNAAELDPGMEEAKQQMQAVQCRLESFVRDDMAGSVLEQNGPLKETMNQAEVLRAETGVVLSSGEKHPVISALEAPRRGNKVEGLEEGDRIVAVWGQITAYMSPEEVAGMILSSGEAELTIERTVKPVLVSDGKNIHLFSFFPFFRYERLAGASLRLSRKGVIIGYVVPGGAFAFSGIARDDLIFRMNGRNARYMPMSEIEGIIKENRGKEIEIDIRRDVTIWTGGMVR